ncbi:MAG: DUF4294 domain-containing protein [Marinilabiliales bacterium]|nr:DUF4294 domain-containing protein [Marinilabiliales bacterium]
MKLLNYQIRFYWILLLFVPFAGMAQQDPKEKTVQSTEVTVRPDSAIHLDLQPVDIFPDKKDLTPRQFRQYSLLELKVKKVYPIAKLASRKLAEYDRVYASFKTERERKNYVKAVEKDLFKEYEPELRSMKVSEGKILIKLLDRETGRTSYEIIKEFKGGFAAFFWQSVARLFGHDLKSLYSPDSEDRMIECIVQQIDLGLI